MTLKKISLLLLWVGFLFVVFSIVGNERKLKSCSKETKALVFKRINSARKMPIVFYIFTVDGVDYKSSTSLHSKYDIGVGSMILVRYYCDDPSVNEFVRN